MLCQTKVWHKHTEHAKPPASQARDLLLACLWMTEMPEVKHAAKGDAWLSEAGFTDRSGKTAH